MVAQAVTGADSKQEPVTVEVTVAVLAPVHWPTEVWYTVEPGATEYCVMVASSVAVLVSTMVLVPGAIVLVIVVSTGTVFVSYSVAVTTRRC